MFGPYNNYLIPLVCGVVAAGIFYFWNNKKVENYNWKDDMKKYVMVVVGVSIVVFFGLKYYGNNSGNVDEIMREPFEKE